MSGITPFDYNYIIIGAGNIAYSLSAALQNSGFEILQIVSKSLDSAKILANNLNITSYSNNYILEKSSKSRIIILAVPDSQIKSVVEELAINNNLEKDIVIHLSGVLTSDIITELHISLNAASFHILKSFPQRIPYDITGSFCAIEAPNIESVNFLHSLALKLKLNPFTIKKESKILYHILGVAASNFIVANYYFMEKIFEETNIDGIDLNSLTSSIVESTIQNIKKQGAVKSLSGPVERGDLETIEKHFDSIKDNLLLEFYKSNTKLLTEIAVKKGSISDKTAGEIGKM